MISVSRPGEEPAAPRPDWLRVEHGDQATIRALLPEVRATIQPRRCSPYNEIAVPIKVMEYLAYDRPLVVTDCLEQAAIVRDAGGGTRRRRQRRRAGRWDHRRARRVAVAA